MENSRKKVEFRYYQIPAGDYVMALLGRGWEINYGNDQPEGLLHFHNYMEIGYCYHGHGELIIADRTYRYGDAMFSVIPANIPHTTNSDPGNICKWEFLYIDIDNFIRYEMKDVRIDADALIRVINRRGTLKTAAHHREMAELIRGILEECRGQKAYYKETIKGYLRALVFNILRLDQEHEQIRHENGAVNNYVGKAIRYIDTHYADDLHVADLAAVSDLSESHFRRVFEETTGMKPVDYLNMVRVSKACEIMQKEDVTMADVCKRTGFMTASSFNRNFKSLIGTTPLAWKKEALAGRETGQIRVTARKGWQASEWQDRYREIWKKLEEQEKDWKESAAQDPDVDAKWL